VSASAYQDGDASAGELVVSVEWPLPTRLRAGDATAALISGTCFHREQAVESLEILVGGMRHRPDAFRMPRPDVAEAAGAGARAWHSGFWGTVPLIPRAPGELEIQLAVRLSGGDELLVPAGRIQIAERSPPPALKARPEQDGGGLIVICMATFQPDIGLFRTQIESLRSQTDRRWICLISDDHSRLESFEEMGAVLDGDPRFAVSRSEERLGFYRNFERALGLVPREAELVALSDQDDRWHPDKLEMLRYALGGDAALAYSDLRLVDADRRVLRETFWKGRRANHTNLASMLVANTVAGAAMMFRRELAELALPFPDMPGLQFHDHWLGVLALAAGELAYVDRPLYDYVQHPGAVFGDVSMGPERSAPSRVLDRWRAAYFHGYLARELQARTLLLRCPDRISSSKRRVLRRFLASARSPLAWAWLMARPARALVGRNETLASEVSLAQGIAWRRLVGLCARSGRRRCDARIPPGGFEQRRLRRWRARL
jgi:hypothetical protein